MKILTIAGSARVDSSNMKLLKALPQFFPKQNIYKKFPIAELPLFTADLDKNPLPEKVTEWRATVKEADAVIISTPEYIHNLPALMKNALEWLTTSGELLGKPVLAITFTPHAPRGEKAMQSLLWSLQALEARVVAQLPLYQNEVAFDEEGGLMENESFEMLKEAIRLVLDGRNSD